MVRKRPEMYYLDQARAGNYALYANGEVGYLTEQTVMRERQIPTRVPDRFRTVEIPEKRLVLDGKADSLYQIALGRHHGQNVQILPHPEVLEYVPSDVVARMEQWRDTPSEWSIEQVRASAESKIATRAEIETEQVHCVFCHDDEHACYGSGWSKYFWKYPMVDVGPAGQPNLVTLDVAKVIAENPDALTYEMTYRLQPGDSLTANRYAVLHLDQIPAAYINQPSGMLDISTSDDLSTPSQTASVPIDSWAEYSSGQQRDDHRNFLYGEPAQCPEDVLRNLQLVVAQGAERVEITDYDARWREVRAVLGEKGLALTWQYGYRGMGEADAIVTAVDAETLDPQTYIGNAGEARMMVDDAHRVLIQKTSRSYSRPHYQD